MMIRRFNIGIMRKRCILQSINHLWYPMENCKIVLKWGTNTINLRKVSVQWRKLISKYRLSSFVLVLTGNLRKSNIKWMIYKTQIAFSYNIYAHINSIARYKSYKWRLKATLKTCLIIRNNEYSDILTFNYKNSCITAIKSKLSQYKTHKLNYYNKPFKINIQMSDSQLFLLPLPLVN